MSEINPHELLGKGGSWLGAARRYLQWNVRGGDTCTWGSGDVLEMTVKQIEELAAHAVAADGGYEVRFRNMLDKNTSLDIRLVIANKIAKIHEKTIERLKAENEEMREELSRVQQLPELDWARANAAFLQCLAGLARNGEQPAAKNAVDILDKLKTYVSRTLSERDRLKKALQYIAKGNIAPSINFAAKVLEGKTADQAFKEVVSDDKW